MARGFRPMEKIVWRASRPTSDEDVEEYKSLLAHGLVAPTKMEVFVANADGSDVHQVTDMPGANWAPSFTPDGQHIIFSSNYEHAKGFPFNLYLINFDGTGLEKFLIPIHSMHSLCFHLMERNWFSAATATTAADTIQIFS